MSKKPIYEPSGTDWARLDAMTDDDIDYSDCPALTEKEFARGIVRKGLKPVPRKIQVTVRIDDDVLTWFRSLGAGYQTKINALLRAYMEAHDNK